VDELTLRPATVADADLLLLWRNDPTTRGRSLDTSELSLEPHRAWLADRLARVDDVRIFIAELGEVPVAQLRVEREQARRGVVSVSVDRHARGLGVGTRAIEAGTARASHELDLDEVVAVIRVGNDASRLAFERAGYRRDSETVIDGARVMLFRWSRG
jgi:RimJ/RimL family protein N-acetyltransferase